MPEAKAMTANKALSAKQDIAAMAFASVPSSGGCSARFPNKPQPMAVTTSRRAEASHHLVGWLAPRGGACVSSATSGACHPPRAISVLFAARSRGHWRSLRAFLESANRAATTGTARPSKLVMRVRFPSPAPHEKPQVMGSHPPCGFFVCGRHLGSMGHSWATSSSISTSRRGVDRAISRSLREEAGGLDPLAQRVGYFAIALARRVLVDQRGAH